MADIVLKNKIGEEKTYIGVKSITLPTTDGSKVTFYLDIGDGSFIFELDELIPPTVGTFTYDSSYEGWVFRDINVTSSTFLQNGENGILVWDGNPYGVACGNKSCLVSVNGAQMKAAYIRAIGNPAWRPLLNGNPIDTSFANTNDPFFFQYDGSMGIGLVCFCEAPSTGTSIEHTFQLFKFIHGVQVITFTINGIEYTASPGDTWLSSGIVGIGLDSGKEWYCVDETGTVMSVAESNILYDSNQVVQTGDLGIMNGMSYTTLA